MTSQEAHDLGYRVIAASPFEVGLIKVTGLACDQPKGERGVRTWFCQDFDHRLPSLDHPKIQEAIRIHEGQE